MANNQTFDFSECLFRYREVNDDNINALEQNRLYFSTPQNFNDPFDNLIYANLQSILSNINHNLEVGMDEYIEKLKRRDPESAFWGHAFWNGPQKDKIVNQFFENICNAVDYIKKSVRSNVKIICFSQVYDSMLMWSHYANNHRGYALIYEVDELKLAKRYKTCGEITEKNMHLGEVEYVEKQIDLSEDIEDYVRYNIMPNMGDVERIDGSIPQYKLRKCMLQKSVEWSYEKEWRLLPRIIDLQHPSPLGYIECVPKGIILGVHCNAEDSNKIENIAKKIDVPVYRMSLNEFSPQFKLNIGENDKVKII